MKRTILLLIFALAMVSVEAQNTQKGIFEFDVVGENIIGEIPCKGSILFDPVNKDWTVVIYTSNYNNEIYNVRLRQTPYPHKHEFHYTQNYYCLDSKKNEWSVVPCVYLMDEDVYYIVVAGWETEGREFRISNKSAEKHMEIWFPPKGYPNEIKIQVERSEPEANFKNNSGESRNEDSRALFPTKNTTEKASASENTGYGLKGRYIIGSLPRPDYSVNESGVVVVEITVDKNGDVIQASYREQGSTTDNSELVNAALTAAKRARFTSGEGVQTGTITYNFKLF